MSGIGDYISREALVNEIWKALYSYEDEMEATFMADPELDISQWFFHRIFVQTMSSIGLQVILDAPAADVRPVVLCRDCLHENCAMYHGPNWFCADGERRAEL